MMIAEFDQTMTSEDQTKVAGRWLGGMIRVSGYTYQEAAEMLGVHRNTIDKWRRGQRSPTLPNCRKLAEFLGLPVALVVRVLHERSQMPPG